MRSRSLDRRGIARRACALAVQAALLASPACGGNGGTGPSPPSTSYAEYTSAHFIFRHTPLDTSTIAQTAATVESNVGRITASLGAAGALRVTVTLYADRAALQEAVRPVVGTLPSFASGLVTGPDQIHILSPNLVNVWTYDRAVTSIVHEFAHTVTLRVNPTFANNPRWLWESVALYEAGQFVDPRGLSYMTSGQPPTFDQLSAIEDTRVYDVGYVIAEFIVATWGEPGLIALVRQNGNPAAVGAAPEEFRVRWLTFLRDRYGL
jgi:hypothetical protein